MMEDATFDSLRIGTWNLGRSGAFHRPRVPRQLAVLQQRNADLWILTDAHDANVPLGGHVCRSVPHADLHQRGEHRVVLWSRYPLSPVPTDDPVCAVAAHVEMPGMAQPLLVYGTVITAAHGGVVPRQGLTWQRHLDSVHRRRAEWQRLSQDFPDHALCVAGDFNTNLDEAASYGTTDPRHAILRGLADVGMRCLTTDALRGPLEPPGGRASVDHVCFSDVEGLKGHLQAWPATMDGHRLSDRGGILVELGWTPSLQGREQAQRCGS